MTQRNGTLCLLAPSSRLALACLQKQSVQLRWPHFGLGYESKIWPVRFFILRMPSSIRANWCLPCRRLAVTWA